MVTPKPLKKDDLVYSPPLYLAREGQKLSDRSLNIVNSQDVICALLTTITSLITHHTQEAVDSYSVNNEPLLLYIVSHQPKVPRLEISDEEWEEMSRECGGWEWIDGEVEGEGRNEFGGKSICRNLFSILNVLRSRTWCGCDMLIWLTFRKSRSGSTPRSPGSARVGEYRRWRCPT